MYFFVPHKFAGIRKDYKGDKIVICRDSPSEGLMKLFFHYSMSCKWFIHTDDTKLIVFCHGYISVRLLDNVLSDYKDSTLKL